MKKYILGIGLICISLIFSCSQNESTSDNLDGNLDLNLTYITTELITLNWALETTEDTSLNLQAFVFDPDEHNSSMESATHDHIRQLGSFTSERTLNVAVTASLYYVFMLSNAENTYLDCAESNNSTVMQSFDLCQTYLYLWEVFD